MDNDVHNSEKPQKHVVKSTTKDTKALPLVEGVCDNGSGKQNGSGSATNTVIRSLTTDKEWLHMSVPNTSQPSIDEIIASLEKIGNIHREVSLKYTDACISRALYARDAKSAGLTNQRIADALGVTESAVRSLIKRSGGFTEMTKVDCRHCMDFWVSAGKCPECGSSVAGDK